MKPALLLTAALCALSTPLTQAAGPSPAKPADPAPAAKPALKGMELYSWQDAASKEMRYVLLPGTNRAKTRESIMADKGVMNTAADLKKRLQELPAGETIQWNLNPRADAAPWTIPPPETDKAITKFCEELKLKVVRHGC